MKTHVETDRFIKKPIWFYYLQFWLHHCVSLAMAYPGCLVPGQLHYKTATVLLRLCHHSNGIFDPICGILDLDVDQRGIKGAYWPKAAAAAAVLKPQRRAAAVVMGCGLRASVAGRGEDGRILGSGVQLAGSNSVLSDSERPISCGLFHLDHCSFGQQGCSVKQ